MPYLAWWPLIASILHIVEEFVVPGGFAEWDRTFRPAYAASITTRLHVIMNALLLFAGVAVGAAGATPRGVSAWLTLAALLAGNAVFHLVGAIRTRGYSPGMATGLLLYIPLAIYGFAHFVSAHQASIGTAVAAAAIGGSYHLWSAMAHARRSSAAPVVVLALAIAFAVGMSHTQAATPPDRAAAVIETFLRWAIEGKELPADPPNASPALPDRRCGDRFDPEHPPATIYVAWQLSAEAQHAACNWKYDVASRHASPLTPAEAAEVGQRIVAGTVGPQERAFFHSTPQGEGRLKVSAGYCWGSASGTFAFRADGPVLTGDLTVRGY